MRYVGTTIRGIRTPIIKENDNLAPIVVKSILDASKHDNFDIKDRDVIGITEAVCAIAESNFVTVDQVALDIKKKFKNGHVGILFPTPVSRNRFAPYLKGIARGSNKITMQLSFPDDEVGNKLFPEDLLDEYKISYDDVLTADEYNKYFKDCKHLFTGVNYIEFFQELVEAEDCEIEFIFANNPCEILKYADDILICNVHSREKKLKILQNAGVKNVYKLDEIMNESVDGSGFNPIYGLLGSNISSEERLKLLPKSGHALVHQVQELIQEKTGKNVEVMIFADGAFKDPVGGIWELADPVVSPAYTPGLEGTPNEIKLKYIADSKYHNLAGDDLKEALKNEIKAKEDNLVGQRSSLGTTPRRITDLIGSLCDLTSGSGDKGTPVIYISGYFDSMADD